MSQAASGDLKSRIKESYDATAHEYFAKFTKVDDPLRLGHLRQLIEHLKESGKDAAEVLELGCGSGIPATKFLLESNNPSCRVTGNDISTSQLNLARLNLAIFEDRVTLLEADMLSLKFPDSRFDAVTGFYSIIHLPREEQQQLMSKISNWMKPGGVFLANFGADELSAKEEKWMDNEKGWMYWSGWGAKGSLKMVEDAGFEVLSQGLHQDPGDGKFLWVLARKRSV